MDCACHLPLFDIDEEGFPLINVHHRDAIDRLREELIERDPVRLPLLEPPQPWTDWDVGGGPIPNTFVRDSHPDTERAIREAFARKRENEWMFSHADAANHLQSVAWRINEPMLPVVRQFAGLARQDRQGAGVHWGGVGKLVPTEQVWRDVATAKWLTRQSSRFWVDVNTDFRGRFYGIPHFNFMREDHVRSLFLFDEGLPIGRDADWLLIHLANCFDDSEGSEKISKQVWGRRLDWARNHVDLIMRTAINPEETVEWWRKADAPFSFVAACKELAASECRPEYITRLPITLDASCNGLQHLAALARDEVTGALTNLDNSTTVQDAYREILKLVRAMLEGEQEERSSARYWLSNNHLNRKLIKRPASTFGYSVTVQGMRDQIVEEDKRQHGNEPKDYAAWYLAHRVMRACRQLFKKPAEVMDTICAAAGHLANNNMPLRWDTPTGFPVINGYYLPNIIKIDNKLRGDRVRFKVADGWKSTIDAEQAVNAAAPNFVHSLDASHAARVINAAVSEPDPITNVTVIHDCYASLAPQVQRLQQIVRQEFYLLHVRDQLAGLRDRAWEDLWNGALCNERAATAAKLLLERMPQHGLLELANTRNADFMTS